MEEEGGRGGWRRRVEEEGGRGGWKRRVEEEETTVNVDLVTY